MTFKDGATTLCTQTLSSGRATCATSGLAVGSHTISATYGGDPNFASKRRRPDSDGQQGDQRNAAEQQPQSLDLRSVGDLHRHRQLVGRRTTGSVTFKDGATTLCTQTLSSGRATCATSGLAVGSHTISATYGGDPNFASSAGALTQTVSKTATNTTVTVAATTTVYAQPLTYTVTVTAVSPGSRTPDGTVQWKVDGVSVSSPVTLVGGSATFAVPTPPFPLAAGGHAVRAIYNGSATFAASNSNTINQTITKAPTTSSNLSGTPNPAARNATVTYTITMRRTDVYPGTPDGSIQWTVDGIVKATLPVGTRFTYSWSAAGSHTVRALYQGSTNYALSTSAPFYQTIGAF